jgi:CRP-like cAMP-binding protein
MNNGLYLSDKLTIIALRNLIPDQTTRPVTFAAIAAFSGISPRTVSTAICRLRRRGIVDAKRERVGQPYRFSLMNVPTFDENVLLKLVGE